MSEVAEALARLHARAVSVLALVLSGAPPSDEPLALARHFVHLDAARSALAPILSGRGGVAWSPSPDALLVAFDDPADALLVALDAARALAALPVPHIASVPATAGAHAHGARQDGALRARVGLAHGVALLVPGAAPFGLEVTRAVTLAHAVARPGESLATAPFLAALGALPPGVGAFRGPAERTQAAGYAFHALVDHR